MSDTISYKHQYGINPLETNVMPDIFILKSLIKITNIITFPDMLNLTSINVKDMVINVLLQLQ